MELLVGFLILAGLAGIHSKERSNTLKFKIGEFACEEHKHATFLGLTLFSTILVLPVLLWAVIPWMLVGYVIWRPKVGGENPDYHLGVGVGMLMVWPYMLFLKHKGIASSVQTAK